MEIAFFWIAFSVAVGVWAGNRGRSGFGWFLLSLIISPLLGFVFCAVVGDRRKTASTPTADTHLKCPACAEWVLPEAHVCKHCGGPLTPQPDYATARATDKSQKDRKDLIVGLGALLAMFAIAFIIASL